MVQTSAAVWTVCSCSMQTKKSRLITVFDTRYLLISSCQQSLARSARRLFRKEASLGNWKFDLDHAGGSTPTLGSSEGTGDGLFHVPKDLRGQHTVHFHTSDFFANAAVEIAFKIWKYGFGDAAEHFVLYCWLAC